MTREITGEQLRHGYYEMRGVMVYHREYTVLHKIGDGRYATYIVKEPEPENEDGFTEEQWSGNV